MDNRINFNILGLKLSFINILKNSNNRVILTKNGISKRKFFVWGLRVKFYGADNVVEFFDEIPNMKNVNIVCGSKAQIRIAKSKNRIKNLTIDGRANGISVNIGEDFSVESAVIDFHGEPETNVIIGKDCQFGCNIRIDTADGHSIYDTYTKELLNPPKDVIIGNHVWLCRDVSVLKGAVIPNNCVVAKGSIVTSKFSIENKVLAGIPAVEKGRNINWSRTPNKDYIPLKTED